MQHLGQNNTSSLGVAISTDKRQPPKLWGNTDQSPGKGRGKDEVQVQKMKTKLFSILGSAIFEIYADTTHEDYSKHILTNTNIFCMACPLILFSTFPTTILLLYKHTIGNTGTIVFERMILSNAVTQKKKKKRACHVLHNLGSLHMQN